LIPNPIHKVLSTLTRHHVRFLLMGGQACVLYGAAQFSRDTDIVIPMDRANLQRLQLALDELEALRIAVPPFDEDYLGRGHAVHFRCQHKDAKGTRLDVMALMRNVPPFEELWSRRRTIELKSGLQIDLLGVADLVMAKKTQRDKDWPMIRELVDTHFQAHQDEATPARVDFWLREARSVPLLQKLATLYPDAWRLAQGSRPLLALAIKGQEESLDKALAEEERIEREADRQYWSPLKKELERLRHSRPSP
jgi:hypothetical protein